MTTKSKNEKYKTFSNQFFEHQNELTNDNKMKTKLTKILQNEINRKMRRIRRGK